jgi:transposase
MSQLADFKQLPDLKQMSEADKDALIVLLWETLQKTSTKPPRKTSKNSSLPPAQGFKAAVKDGKSQDKVKRKGSIGRAGGGRQLSEHPDQFIKAELKSCITCGREIPFSMQQLLQRYDKVELPPIRPVVTRVERYGCTCTDCGTHQLAAVPVGMEPGSPFGNGVAAVVTTLRYGHMVSYSRMTSLLGEMFGLSISEGGIANLLKRVQQQLSPSLAGIAERLRSSRLVGSDETSARVEGKTMWEWVFQNAQVCLHVIRPSRSAAVIGEVMGEHRPQIWVSDLFSAQKKHPAEDWQICLAHQLRDTQYGIDAGDAIFSPVMKQILLRACVLHRRWDQLAQSTQYQYRCQLYRRLEHALALQPTQADGVRLQKRYRDLREHLFLFLEDTTIPPTNNASEQALRMSVIFRKVTNGFRSDWGADLFADVRSVINTGKRQGMSAFEAISAALNPLQSLFPLS